MAPPAALVGCRYDRNHRFTDQDAGALLLYATTHGHTAKIAARLAEAMRGAGLAVDLHEGLAGRRAEPGRYALVVVAGSLHREHHQKELVAWVSERRDALAGVPSVFLSVSLSAAEDTESHAATQRCIDAFCEETGWAPTRSVRIAGALQYREYDAFTRQLMRLLMKRMGHPTDASQDYDYTDWDGVLRLGRELAAMVASGALTVADVMHAGCAALPADGDRRRGVATGSRSSPQPPAGAHRRGHGALTWARSTRADLDGTGDPDRRAVDVASYEPTVRPGATAQAGREQVLQVPARRVAVVDDEGASARACSR